MAALDRASDTDYDDGGCAAPPVTLATFEGAIAAVDNAAYVPWEVKEFSHNPSSQLGGTKAVTLKCKLPKRLLETLYNFFQRQ